ncbi:MAG: inositol monophosphatase family protein [Candidatus Kerfeldbacteria bacterium]
MKELINESLIKSGEVLMKYFGEFDDYSVKGDQSNIVTKADIESEQVIVELIKNKYPKHNIIAEESGFVDNESEYTWIVDPLDGTSNYAVGIPWFGSMIALVKKGKVLLAGVHLPATKEIYLAELGEGVTKNGQEIGVTEDEEMQNLLIAYSLDFSEDIEKIKEEVNPIVSIVQNARNFRSTNSVIDSCYVADGRLGGCVYRTAKIWDVAATSLIVEEAGGLATDIISNKFDFKVDRENYLQDYSFVAASQPIHDKMISFINSK